MQRTRKKTEEKPNKGGRPGEYKENTPERAYKLCLLGLKDAELAVAFGVCVDTIDQWKRKHPEFNRALKRGKEQADMEVANSLFKRATGYSYKDTHIMANKVKEYDENGKVARQYTEPLLISITKHQPPDTTAAIFWLKNRQKEYWRDVKQNEVSGKDGGPIKTQNQITPKIDFTDFTDEELSALEKMGIKNATSDDDKE
jgi:hypothetical protein